MLRFERYFTSSHTNPYDTVEWSRRDVVITDYRTGDVKFEQRGVEFPTTWSDNAVQIVTSKYFRGHDDQRENSLKTLINRIVNKYTESGILFGYFDNDSAAVFSDELTYLLLHQYVSFNSPVWFNIGTSSSQVVSACFLLGIDDSLDGISEWITNETQIFKGGSGAGVNLSALRGSNERLSTNGTSSGPASFMRAADANAGAIKSGGASRRAAAMRLLNIDHPDIEQFIRLKADEERKIAALKAAGYDMGIGGEAINSVQYQNANNSVRITDLFMDAYEHGDDWDLLNRTDGAVAKTVSSRKLFRDIAQAAWECADPGVQFHDTFNKWHTCPNDGVIRTTNPCTLRGTKLLTKAGYINVEDLTNGEHEIFDGIGYATGRVWKTGVKSVVRLTTGDGRTIDVTPDHRIYTSDGWVEAQHCVGKSIPRNVAPISCGTETPDIYNPVDEPTDTVTSVEDLGVVGDVYDFSVETTHMGVANGIVIHNCGEYAHIDYSSCNLASLNLVQFVSSSFIDDFLAAINIIITAMDISISFAEFPVKQITENTRRYRQLGLGYTNLGALLMSHGIAYDSDKGRDYARAITALMNAAAHETSSRIALELGAYDRFEDNKDAHLSIVQMHKQNARPLVDNEFLEFYEVAAGLYSDALANGVLRNAQLTLLAPTGTISFMMDATTTGIEPAFSLLTEKRVASGERMMLPCTAVAEAIDFLAYTDEQLIDFRQHIIDTGTVPGWLRAEDKKIFETAVGSNSVSPEAHIKMMAAVQPHLSGAISKTVNMPESATVEDIEKIYYDAWKLGIKGLAVYRDNCKVDQPLTSVEARESDYEALAEAPVQDEYHARRRRMPRRRQSETVSFNVGGAEGYMITSKYGNGDLGELFLKISKEGSTIAGLTDAFAIAISIGLQYGAPLETFIEKFAGTRFEPSGITDDGEIPFASSIIDYVFRRLALDTAETEESEEYDADEPEEVERQARTEQHDGPPCNSCGSLTVRSGSCHVCTACGTTTGCS